MNFVTKSSFSRLYSMQTRSVCKAFLFVLIAFFASCGDDSQDVTLNFALNYGGEPLVMLDEYDYPSGESIKFTRVSFYISDLRANTVSNNSVLLEDIDLINLSTSHSTREGAEEGFSFTVNDAVAEDVESYSFLLGVNPELNSSVPADFSSGHPLANSGEYWIAWDSFIFFKIEGILDTDNDGDFETNIALHVGSDAASREISFRSSDSSNESIDIDVRSIFESDGTVYNIQENPQIHSLFQLDKANFLIQNLAKQIDN